jgi:hypothetical protein
MSLSNPHFTGWTAVAGGIIGVIGFVSLILLFTVGEPFGTINDVLAIPTGLLLMPLVFALYRLNAPGHAPVSLIALVAGVTGFLATGVGSILLVSGRIDFVQSLLPGIGGFGLIGLWVLLNSVMGLLNSRLPSAVAWSGLLLGITPSLALLAVFQADRVGQALSGMAGQSAGFQASPVVYLIFVLGFISYAGLPIWFIVVGRLFLSDRLTTAAMSTAAAVA